MDDSPVESLRRKRDSSIRVGFQLVKTGDAGAFVGAGNSGAMMAAGVMREAYSRKRSAWKLFMARQQARLTSSSCMRWKSRPTLG